MPRADGQPPSPLAGIRALAEDPALRDSLFLVKQGVPFDVAFSLDDDIRFAWVVVCGELDGGSFDWDLGSWCKQSG